MATPFSSSHPNPSKWNPTNKKSGSPYATRESRPVRIQLPKEYTMTKTHKQPTQNDPFAGDFSQNRALPAGPDWAIIQWHGGIASLIGDGESMKVNGGFFIEGTHLEKLGLDINEPFAPFERVSLRLGGKNISGWGANYLDLAFIFADFCWEDRETGKFRFPPDEYTRRKTAAPGTERELRGRTRTLVAVRPFLAEGITQPVILSVRGSYSANLNEIIRNVGKMALEATRLRKQAGHDGAIAREAFWVQLYAGAMQDVGNGSNTSRVALPYAHIPNELTRQFLGASLVEVDHRRAGGTFDQWATDYKEAWEQTVQPTPATEAALTYVDESTGELLDEPPPPAAPVAAVKPNGTAKERAIATAQAELKELVIKLSAVQYGRGAALPKTIAGLHVLIGNHGWENPNTALPEIALNLLGRTPDQQRPLTEGEANALVQYLAKPNTGAVLDAIWVPAPAKVVDFNNVYANP
jgi:hypothetical protein